MRVRQNRCKKKNKKKTEQHIEVTHIFLANNMVNQITPYTVLRYLYNHNKILINKKMHIIITPLQEITNQNKIFHSMNYLIIHRDFKRRRKKKRDKHFSKNFLEVQRHHQPI